MLSSRVQLSKKAFEWFQCVYGLVIHFAIVCNNFIVMAVVECEVLQVRDPTLLAANL